MANSKITPFLWFDSNAEEAINFYTSVFAHSSVQSLMRMPDGKVMTAGFQLNGQGFAALNGGLMYTFNPATSFFVVCETKEESDEIWHTLTTDGQILMPLNAYPWSAWYGWGQDRFGVSWQVMLNAKGENQQQLLPSLMFAGELLERADEAVNFYVSTFKNAKTVKIDRYTEGEPAPTGSVKYAEFDLEGLTFTIMGSHLPHGFQFNEAISFVINCQNQTEIDDYWQKLTDDGGQEGRCGWLKDKFGVSWQVVPTNLGTLLSGNNDGAKAQRAMQAMMQMNKLDIAVLQNA